MTAFTERYGKALGRADYEAGRPMILPELPTPSGQLLRLWYMVGWGEAMQQPASYRKRLARINEQMGN